MAKPGVPPPAWAQAGLYPASTYPVTNPWGTPNPVGGLPTPWSGQPRLMAVGLAAFADAGLTPQIPTPASPFNSWLSLVQELAQWSFDGTFTPAADAHVMETDGAGTSSALTYEATTGFQGVGPTKAPFPSGAKIFAGEVLELNGSASISGGTNSNVSTTTTTITERRWVDSTTILPAFPGRTRYNETFFSVHDAAGNIHTFDEPTRGYLAALNTPNSITDGPGCVRRVKHNEPIWITIGCRYEGDTALSNMNYRIEVFGPLGTLDAIIDTVSIDIANKGYSFGETLQFTPTDLWPAEAAIQDYTFVFRAGVSGGNLTSKRLHISAVSAVQV